jgi:hypothetical protein
MIKRYTAPVTNTQVKIATVGAEFDDHGKQMVITWIGEPYRDGNNRTVFDAEAVELVIDAKRHPSKRQR